MSSGSTIDSFFNRISGRQEIDIKQRINAGDDGKIVGNRELIRDDRGRYFVHLHPSLTQEAVLYRLGELLGHDGLKGNAEAKLEKRRESTLKGFKKDLQKLIPDSDLRKGLNLSLPEVQSDRGLCLKHIDYIANNGVINHNEGVSFHENIYPDINYDKLEETLFGKERLPTDDTKYGKLIHTNQYDTYKKNKENSLELIKNQIPAEYHSKFRVYGGGFSKEKVDSVVNSLKAKDIISKNDGFPQLLEYGMGLTAVMAMVDLIENDAFDSRNLASMESKSTKANKPPFTIDQWRDWRRASLLSLNLTEAQREAVLGIEGVGVGNILEKMNNAFTFGYTGDFGWVANKWGLGPDTEAEVTRITKYLVAQGYEKAEPGMVSFIGKLRSAVGTSERDSLEKEFKVVYGRKHIEDIKTRLEEGKYTAASIAEFVELLSVTSMSPKVREGFVDKFRLDQKKIIIANIKEKLIDDADNKNEVDKLFKSFSDDENKWMNPSEIEEYAILNWPWRK